MNNFFIYSFSNKEKELVLNYTIVFCSDILIQKDIFGKELSLYFQKNIQPDKLIIIGGDYIKDELKKLVANIDDILANIPNFLKTHYKSNLSLLIFDKNGELDVVEGKKPPLNLIKKLKQEGLICIFKKHGGKIEAQKEAHHFVFPSGKHCDQFLRTGNVLVHSSEIYFIAFNMLDKYNHEKVKCIYCDTSSINSLAFALIELKRRLTKDLKTPHIESFGSYERFEDERFTDIDSSLILISSSTSGNIVDRLNKKLVPLDKLVLIFYLGEPSVYESRIICDLTKNEKENQNGIEPFVSYNGSENCAFCKAGSFPLKIRGDVFLIEKPRINRVIISTKHAPAGLSSFMEDYKSKGLGNNNIIKCHFKEGVNGNGDSYEIYLDISAILNKEKDNPRFWKRFNSVINQYVPSNCKYIVHLDDEGSKEMAEIILREIKDDRKNLPKLISQHEVTSLEAKDAKGSILVVCSCLVTGRNLLYVSQALRHFDKFSITYLVGFARPNSEGHLDLIRKNLKQGELFQGETNVFFVIDKIFTPNLSHYNSWEVEKEFIKSFLVFCESSPEKYGVIKEFLLEREAFINTSATKKGLAYFVFLPNVIKDAKLRISNPKKESAELKIRKNFAFFNFKGNYHEEVSQSDIYFTLSVVINNLRQSKNLNECLLQAEHVRNVIDPSNFERYNDGIIQASILRTANSKELAYDLDKEDSLNIKRVMENLVEYCEEDHGEALVEFLFAVSIMKLRMFDEHLKAILIKLKEKTNNEIIHAYCDYIENTVLVPMNKPETFKKYNKNI